MIELKHAAASFAHQVSKVIGDLEYLLRKYKEQDQKHLALMLENNIQQIKKSMRELYELTK